jgi:tRNA(Ile)-lysidine synthase
MQQFLSRITQTIKEQHLLDGINRLVVGVSGGADSVALLCGLTALKNLCPAELVVAHLNHMIRGYDAQADEEFVQELAGTLGLRCLTDRCDVPQMSRDGGISIEMAARDARHAFFAQVIEQEKADGVAVAHTADDQVETILLRLFRGCGLLGLSGIPYSNEIRGMRIIRPLRDVTHQDAERFLLERGRSWREDESNQQDDYMRNRVRHEVLPMLEDRMNPRVRSALLRMSDIVRADNDWLDRTTGRDYESVAGIGRAEALSVKKLNRLPLGEQRRVIMKWLAEQHVDQRSLDAESIRRIKQLADAVRGTKSIPLKSGWQVVRVYDELVLQRRSQARKSRGYQEEVAIPGLTALTRHGLAVTVEETRGIIRQKGARIGELPLVATVSAEAVGDAPLYVRSWRFGDVFRPLGLDGHKKVQDVFVNRKVPRACRATWPLFECRGEIIWIPGYQIAKGWELHSEEQPALKITVREHLDE